MLATQTLRETVMTSADQLSAGVAALKDFVEKTKGFLDELAIPENVYEGAVTKIIAAEDFIHGGEALMDAITDAGYGDQVTGTLCEDAARIVLAATAAPQEEGPK